ncbi:MULTISPECIES: zinc ribbon domain-containing protein [Haloferacaceae]|uniref:Zinc ribbon domain-containing protein n=1 Tax=Halorubrum glutamatedens TaxID=2707018 RepID=A0ABD5QUD4_9EURY|nr:zinc ribbon domain-containing protein [Halobellus captivus]
MRRRLRAPVAALLATFVPGLGHAFLGRFGRAIVWHVTVLGGAVALYSLSDAGPVDPTGSVADVAAAIPPEIALPISVLVGLSAVDAYLVARSQAAEADRAAATAAAIRRHATDGAEEDGTGVGREPAEPEAAETPDRDHADVECPQCGRETDATLDFCHWCTEPLPWADDGE